MYRPVTLALVVLVLGSASLAQTRRCDPANLRVKVLYSNSRSARNHTQVDLTTPSNTPVARKFTDDTGNVEFLDIRAASYRVRIVDTIVEDTVSDEIALQCGESRVEMVTARLKGDAEAELKTEERTEAMVSALDLNVPGSAKKEFQKGADAMQQGDNPTALKHLLKAVDIYPQYAMAWNHLGVIFMQSGDPAHGKEAFEKAVALNDHYPSALINLAKVRFGEKNLPEAENLLRKAVSSDPTNAEALAILADALLVTGPLDEALGLLAKLQVVPHSQFAQIHLLAGDALARNNRPQDAATQYNLFLQEAPAAQGADHAKKALAHLKMPPPAR
jgi:tetratricopeptide (TPR) repeat protein